MSKIPSGNAFLNPQSVLNAIGIHLGDKVADFGCGGAAYFVLQAAKMVGSRGIVYGVDVLKPALSGLKSRLELHNITNVVPVWSNVETYGATRRIRSNSLTVGMIINTLFQAQDKTAMIREAERMVAPGGRLVIIDWKTGGLPFGPTQKQLVVPETIQAMAEKFHLKLTDVFEPGKYHFGLIFTKAETHPA
ncbi:MAG: methyltransferase domain-containing protein [Patescibacteria group bacterium]|jgi:ubiquinone/menaquinone biosynthesis C-methylase UbiE